MANALHPEALKAARDIAAYLGYEPSYIDSMASGYRVKLPHSILANCRHQSPGCAYYALDRGEAGKVLAKLQAKLDKSPYKNLGIKLETVGMDEVAGYKVPYSVENEHFNIDDMVAEIVAMKTLSPKAVKAVLRRAYAAGKASK